MVADARGWIRINVDFWGEPLCEIASQLQAPVGDTPEETREEFRRALAEHFDAMREVGEPIPEPRTAVDYVEVAA